MPIAGYVAFLSQGYVYDHAIAVKPTPGELTPDEVSDVEQRCHGLLHIRRIHHHATHNGILVVVDYNNRSQLLEI